MSSIAGFINHQTILSSDKQSKENLNPIADINVNSVPRCIWKEVGDKEHY